MFQRMENGECAIRNLCIVPEGTPGEYELCALVTGLASLHLPFRFKGSMFYLV